MKYDLNDDIMQECADRHFDFLREYRLSGNLEYLKGFIIDLINQLTTEPTADEQLESFWKSITVKEREALGLIIQTIGQEGNVSIVKLMQMPPRISRPVFDSLLRKLDSYHIAEVTSQGVKGTKITFLFPTEVIYND